MLGFESFAEKQLKRKGKNYDDDIKKAYEKGFKEGYDTAKAEDSSTA